MMTAAAITAYCYVSYCRHWWSSMLKGRPKMNHGSRIRTRRKVRPSYEANISISDADLLSARRRARNHLHRRLTRDRPTGTEAAHVMVDSRQRRWSKYFVPAVFSDRETRGWPGPSSGVARDIRPVALARDGEPDVGGSETRTPAAVGDNADDGGSASPKGKAA